MINIEKKNENDWSRKHYSKAHNSMLKIMLYIVFIESLFYFFI